MAIRGPGTLLTLDARPTPLDLYVYQGDDLLISFAATDTVTGLPVTGLTAGAAQVRSSIDRASSLVASFTVTITDAPNGLGTALLPASQADLLSVGSYYWDLQLTINGLEHTYYAGSFFVSAETTVA